MTVARPLADGGDERVAQISTDTTSWTWDAVPYPLPYAPAGLYEIELRPAVWNLSAAPGTLNVPVLARSTYFTIGEDSPSQVSTRGSKIANRSALARC